MSTTDTRAPPPAPQGPDYTVGDAHHARHGEREPATHVLGIWLASMLREVTPLARGSDLRPPLSLPFVRLEWGRGSASM